MRASTASANPAMVSASFEYGSRGAPSVRFVVFPVMGRTLRGRVQGTVGLRRASSPSWTSTQRIWMGRVCLPRRRGVLAGERPWHRLLRGTGEVTATEAAEGTAGAIGRLGR